MDHELCEHVPPISGGTDKETSGILNIQDLNLEEASKRKGDRKPDELLHHCLPVTNLKLLEGIVLVASEGPSILMKMAYFEKQSFQRHQLFPSQFIISGMEFVSCPNLECGESPALWHKKCDKPYDYIYVGFVWAGSTGTVIGITRSSKGDLHILEGKSGTEMITLDFIPVAAKWLEGGNVLALLSVLNCVVLYERVSQQVDCPGMFTGLKELTRIKCDKSETLFSGTISGSSRGDIRIFAGTVFNGICVWDVVGDQGVIRHELKCHNGIVFSLEYYSYKRILLSTSDDRTVAVWEFSGTKEEEQVTLRHRFYGHEARVWKALLVHDNYIISVGESSEIRVNKLNDGTEHKTWRAHDGGPIFTCTYDEDVDILYTGGAEGSIRKWVKWWYRLQPRILPFDVIPFDPDTDDKNRIQGSGRWSMNKDFPKMALLLDINHAIVSMDSGRVIGMTWEGKQFDLLHDSRCEGYQIIKLSPDQKVLAVAGKDGHFYKAEIAFSENQSSKTTVLYARKLFMTKISWNILSMIWLDNSRLLIICFNRAIAMFFKENEKGERSEASLIQTFNLNLSSRPGVPAAVEICGKHIVLGDELGTLHLFRYHKTNEAIQKLENAHKDGVSDLLFHESKLYSTGRDGLVKMFSININKEDDLQAEFIHLTTFSMPFDWVAGIYVNMGQMLVCGFLKEDFVVHSLNEKRTIAKIPCGGGGNKKWDFKYGHGSEGSINASFVFVKEKEIFYSFLPMAGHLNVVIKEGLHSRTINCALKLPQSNSDKEKQCYITGSEDGSLKWFEWDSVNQRILSVENMENHVSSVRSAWKITNASNQTFIFTGGGRSQLCIYKIDLDNRRMDLLKEIILVKTTCKQIEGDVRIMDISVVEVNNDELLCFGGCSDGFVRVLYFNTNTNKFRIAGILNGNNHAVMKIQLPKTEYFQKNKFLVCGVTSNGYMLLWSWNANEDDSIGSPLNKNALPEKNPEFVKLLRKTAFMSMQAYSSKLNCVSIVCGGDDCSVSLWSLDISKENSDVVNYNIKEIWTRDQNQRGAVVGVCMDDKRIYSISNDQIVGYWNLNGELERTIYAGVSDCQGFVMDKKNECILCFGKGVSWVPS